MSSRKTGEKPVIAAVLPCRIIRKLEEYSQPLLYSFLKNPGQGQNVYAFCPRL